MENLAVNAHIPILPGFILILVLAIGVVLALKRPFHGYLFSLAIPLSLAIPTMTFTRLPGLGPYFNLYDACFLTMAVAVLSEASRGDLNLRPPGVVLAMVAVLVLGFVIATWNYGISYETLRALRWGINVPVYLFAGFVMLREPSRHTTILKVLLVAVIAAELQHLYLVVTSPAIESTSQLGQLRSSMFQLAKSEIWLLAGPYLIGRTAKRRWLQVAVACLFLTAAITTQTRTLALGLAGGMLLYWLFIVRADPIRRKHYIAAALLVCALTLLVVIPRLHLGGVADSFSSRLTGFFVEGVVDDSALSRQQSFTIEGRDWLVGGPFVLLCGNGLDYYSKKYSMAYFEGSDSVAFGHLGYITYLSQLGALGFLVYAAWFPIVVIRCARRIYFEDHGPATHHLAALCAASFLYSTVAFLFSSHYLVNDVVAGTLAGFAFATPSTSQS